MTRLGWIMLITLIVPGLALAAGPEVSHSRGRNDGVVVLWPRLVPETEDPVIVDLARRLQQRVADTAAASVDARRIDLRPAPERVCPRAGCKTTSITLMLGHQDGGCALIGLVGPAGPEPQRLVPLAGKFQMGEPYLPFRSPPEGQVIVTEFVACAELEQLLDPAALRLMLPGSAPLSSSTPAAPTP
jgi:hypothetical protein